MPNQLTPELWGTIIGGAIGILGSIFGAIVSHSLSLRRERVLAKERRDDQKKAELEAYLTAGSSVAAERAARTEFPFIGGNALRFPRSEKTREQLIKKLDDVLNAAKSDQDWDQTAELVDSALDWLATQQETRK